MKIVNLILYILLYLSINSCQNSKKETFTEFPVMYNLQGRITNLDKPYRSGTVYIADSLVILTNTPSNTRYIHLFSLKDFEFISSSGIIGRGPGEINNPFFAICDAERGIIWCMDQGKRRILCFPLDSIIDNENFSPSSSIPVPIEKHLIIHYKPFNNELFSFLNDDPNILVSFFDYNGNIIDTLDIIDQLELYEEIDYETSRNIVTYMYSCHPSNKKIAIAARFSDKLVIIDYKGNILNRIHGPDFIDQTPEYAKSGLKLTYFDIRSDSKFIYCLYNGLEKVKEINGMLTSTFPMSLHVFDWCGNPISQIRFEYSASSFAIDAKYNRIVTFSPDVGIIVCYELPDLSK